MHKITHKHKYNKDLHKYPIALRAIPATVAGSRDACSIHEVQKLYINLLKILEGC